MLAKRTLDIFLALSALVLFSPLLLVAMLTVWRDMGRPILFSQVRPGLRGRPFRMYKFRTMREATDAHGRPLPDAERLTPAGAWLRSTSLDELPEVFNVLRGDMSIVGPRPLLMAYLPLYSPHQARRHEVKPGITGWAQINGRNALSWERKFDLDVWYVDHRSFWLDLKIIGATFAKVARREGVAGEGQATMEPFRGSTTQQAG
jgi:lipopolysaccharide/colanic/teichoic acid biosynthesis glycosyltransferase